MILLLSVVQLRAACTVITVCASGCDQTSIALALAASSSACDIIELREDRTEQVILTQDVAEIRGAGARKRINFTGNGGGNKTFIVNGITQKVVLRNLAFDHSGGNASTVQIDALGASASLHFIDCDLQDSSGTSSIIVFFAVTNTQPGMLILERCTVQSVAGSSNDTGIQFPNSYTTAGGVRVVNSIFKNLLANGIYFTDTTANVMLSCYHTLFVGCGTGVRSFSAVDLKNCLFINNVTDLNLSNGGNASQATYCGFSAATGGGANCLYNLATANEFVAFGTGDYHLASTALARNAGTSAGVSDDKDLAARPQEAFYDIGPYEYVPPTTPTSTMTPSPSPSPTFTPGYLDCSIPTPKLDLRIVHDCTDPNIDYLRFYVTNYDSVDVAASDLEIRFWVNSPLPLGVITENSTRLFHPSGAMLVNGFTGFSVTSTAISPACTLPVNRQVNTAISVSYTGSAVILANGGEMSPLSLDLQTIPYGPYQSTADDFSRQPAAQSICPSDPGQWNMGGGYSDRYFALFYQGKLVREWSSQVEPDPDTVEVPVCMTCAGVPTATPTSTPTACVSLYRVNTGGGSYLSAGGDFFGKDKAWTGSSYGYLGGASAGVTTLVGSTLDPLLYQSERYGTFSYQFQVANGSYQVRLHLAEIYFTAAGQRIFDVQAESLPLFDDLDIVSLTTSNFRAIVLTTTTTVADGTLSLDFVVQGPDVPKVSAIEILPLALCGTPTFSMTPSGTPTRTVTETRTVTPSITPSITRTSTVTPSDTPSITETRTVTPSITPSVTPSITPSISETRTVTPSVTPSNTQSSTVTPSITPSITETSTVTPSVTPSNTQSSTVTPSITPSVTETRTVTPSVTPSNTQSSTVTPSITPSITETRTVTPSVTPSNTQSSTVTPSLTPSVTETRTVTPSVTPSSTETRTATETWTATPSHTPSITSTSTMTGTYTATLTITPSITETRTATESVTVTVTQTCTVTPSDTPSISATPTFSVTGTATETSTSTYSATETRTASPPATSTDTPSASVTLSATPTATGTSTVTETVTPTPPLSPTPSFTISPTPTATPALDVTLTLIVRDAAGMVVRSLSALGDHLVSDFTLSSDPYDPYQGNLTLKDGAWTMAYDGLDSSGVVLPNGLYTLELSSVKGGSSAQASKPLRIVSTGKTPPKAAVVPSLILPGTTLAVIFWAPAVAAEVRVYNLNAELLRSFNIAAGLGRVNWDLRSSNGQAASSGVYLVAIRESGAKKPTVVKIFLKR